MMTQIVFLTFFHTVLTFFTRFFPTCFLVKREEGREGGRRNGWTDGRTDGALAILTIQESFSLREGGRVRAGTIDMTIAQVFSYFFHRHSFSELG